MYVFLVEECEMKFRWHVWRYDKQNREMISEGFDKTKLTFQWQPLLMMTVGILLRWQSWDRSIHTQFEFGRRLKHPSWYTFQSLQAVHRSFFYSIIDNLDWWYLLGSSTRYTQSIHDDDNLSVEFLNNPSPNLDEGGDDYPNPMMRVMTVLVLGLV